MKNLSMIAAVGKNLELGKNNQLIWHLDGDLPFFKRVTMGKPVIMGSHTFRSLPKALPGRQNIVITSNPAQYDGMGVTAVSSVNEALQQVNKADEAFIIGGGSIYRQFLPLANRLYLTEAMAEDKSAEVYFPEFDKSLYEKTVLDEGGTEIKYAHVLYTLKEE